MPYVWRRDVDPDVDGMLAGTGASVHVNYFWGNPSEAPWTPAIPGTSGDQAGAAYMYQRIGDAWLEVGIVFLAADGLCKCWICFEI